MVSIVVSGPGGVGKGTIVDALLKRHPEIHLSRSWTTRAQRPGEPDDAYVFTDRERFDANIEADGFLEWIEFLDYRQGTPRPEVVDGTSILFEIDVQGAKAVKEWDPDALLIFLDTPSRADQRARLVSRGDSEEKIAARMRKGEQERELAHELGMVWVVNDVLEDAVDDLETLVIEALQRASEAD